MALGRGGSRARARAHARSASCAPACARRAHAARSAHPRRASQTVVLYDAARHEQLEVWAGHAKGVNAVAPLHAPHGDADALAAVSASRDCTLKLWRRGVREAAATLEGHTLTVSAVCAPSVELVVSAGRDASVRSWDVRSGRQVGVARIARNLATFLAPCGPAEPALVVQGSEDLSVRLWDVRAMAVGSTIERTLQVRAKAPAAPRRAAAGGGVCRPRARASTPDARNAARARLTHALCRRRGCRRGLRRSTLRSAAR